MSKFGFGCHESLDEIMLDKYNEVTIYSRELSKYNGFFEAHGIAKVENLVTAWDTFTMIHRGRLKGMIIKENQYMICRKN